MRKKTYATKNEFIFDYIEKLLHLEKDLELAHVLNNAKKYGTPPLQMTPSDLRHVEILVRSIKPHKIVEIGTLCGYSTIALARSLQIGGKIYTLECSEHHAKVAQISFHELGFDDRIELIFGQAQKNLADLSTKGPFDVVFIDADKRGYPIYYDWAIENLRSGGLLIADNVFAFGHIATEIIPEGQLGELIEAMRSFNRKASEDHRILLSFLPTGEGLMLALKI